MATAYPAIVEEAARAMELVTSVRYHFSNLSEDIKALYCQSLDALGIPWTRPCDKQIAVYRKAAAAEMDQFIGPKR